jgi:hypothetical protein
MKDKRLVFYSLLDFFPNRENIKEIYQSKELDDKMIYKMYVYSLPFMEDNIKDLIWEYLNGWEEGQFELARFYRLKKEKLEKRKRLEIHDKEEIT